MQENACDYQKLQELVTQKEEAQLQLDELYARWEELSEALEQA